ncbi:MAG: YkgJ family cysteine cluster protein [Candidatus Methylomirabilales bacterium]
MPAREGTREKVLAALAELYEDVDAEAARLGAVHGPRLLCGQGCTRCCIDGVTVFEVEAEHIRRRHGSLLAGARPHPEGACAFLDDAGACRIYADRPYVCRTQGLPLRWTEEHHDGSIVERRDICPLNGPGPPIETLRQDECWTIGPAEGRLVALQARLAGGRLRRVSLRSLFERPPAAGE